ncbi:MAG: hypothetical protein Q8M94_06990, partial [Ignavibacteria bacterium]|nr:hypothetical protein [Ignavibacteria bacterium]
MNINFTKSKYSGPLLLAAYGIFVIFFSLKNPVFQWDTIAYTACVKSIETKDISIIHHETYNEVKNSLGEQKFKWLTEDNQYREALAKNPDYFNQQLNLYKVKPLYIGVLYLLAKIGFNPVWSTLYFSIFCSLACLFMIFIWLCRYYKRNYCALLTIILGIFANILAVSTESTPDAFSTLLLLLGLFYLFEKNRFILGNSILSLSIFARNDNLIFIQLILIYALFLNRGKTTLSIRLKIFLVINLVSYLLINHYAGAYDWWRFFHHSFYFPNPEIANFQHPFSFDLYSAKVIKGLTQFGKPFNLLLIFLTGLILFHWKNNMRNIRD